MILKPLRQKKKKDGTQAATTGTESSIENTGSRDSGVEGMLNPMDVRDKI